MSSRNLKLIDQRIRMGLRGTERQRGTVDSVNGRIAQVWIAGALVPVIIPALPVALVPGSIVECYRPRGVAEQFQIAHVLGVSGPAAMAATVAATVQAASGYVPIVAALPTPSVGYRGQTILLDGGAGVADTYWRCDKDAADAYGWTDVT